MIENIHTVLRSPFEVKYELLDIAKKAGHSKIYDVSRGNPDFFAAKPRKWFAALLEETLSYTRELGLVSEYQNKTGIIEIYQLAQMIVQLDPSYSLEQVLLDLKQSVIGSNYPVPDRILRFNDAIQNAFIKKIMSLGDTEHLQLFPTNGGADAMGNIFVSLHANYLLHSEDKIAMITPIFTPYLEIPLNLEYNNEIVGIETLEENNWQPTTEELEKLLDPEVKLLCVVNPANPSGVALNESTINALQKIIVSRPDLMIITDDVYCTFVNDFQGLFKHFPFNTMLVYSFSKYFGATGQRLGIIALHQDNVFDHLVKGKHRIAERYEHIAINPIALRFIDRLVADSRSVSLNHVAGLSLAQQLLMCMFSYMYLNLGHIYHDKLIKLLRERFNAMNNILNLENLANNSLYDCYYLTYNLGKINISDVEFAKKLAKDYGIIVCAASGFYKNLESDKTQIRISLANAPAEDLAYVAISIKELQAKLYDKGIIS